MVSLNLADFFFRIDLDKLCILIGRQDEKVFSGKDTVQIKIRAPDRSILCGVEKCDKISPEFTAGIKMMPHPGERAFKTVFFCKFSKMFPERGRIVIIEIPAAGG